MSCGTRREPEAGFIRTQIRCGRIEAAHRQKTKFLNDKYDGQDLYSIAGVLANDLNEVPSHWERKLESEKEAVKVDLTSSRIIPKKTSTNFKKFLRKHLMI